MRKQTKIRPLLRVEKYQKAQGKRQIPHSKLSVHGDETKEHAEFEKKKKKKNERGIRQVEAPPHKPSLRASRPISLAPTN